MKEAERTRRHWLSVGDPVESASKMGREPSQEDKEFHDFCWELGFRHGTGGTDDLVFKTDSSEEAEEVKKKVNERIKSLTFMLSELSHVLQPQCPGCGELARFSASYCEACGTELLPKEYVD